MIKINLLPFRVARKKENIRRQVSIYFLLIIFAVLAVFWFNQRINDKIETIKVKTKKIDSQILVYKAKADTVREIKKKLKILEQKLEIMTSLKQQRKKQLILFDKMTDFIVPERMWLESFQTTQDKVMINGIAFDNPTIADFMKKLENSTLFTQVDLKTAQLKRFKGDVMLKSFVLMCNKTKSEKEKDKDSKQDRK